MVKSGNQSSSIEINFLGTYYHRLEDKGRVSVPKDFRRQLGAQAILTKGLDGCLFLFPLSTWQDLVNKLQSLPFTQKAARAFVRILTYNATLVNFDSLGRIKIPTHLLQIANLQKDVVFAGALSRVEIWNRQQYHTYLDSLDQDQEIAQALEILEI